MMAYDISFFGVLLVRCFGGTAVIVGIVSSPSFSKPLSSNSLSGSSTFWSYMPFSSQANLSDPFKWGDSFA